MKLVRFVCHEIEEKLLILFDNLQRRRRSKEKGRMERSRKENPMKNRKMRIGVEERERGKRARRESPQGGRGDARNGRRRMTARV